MQLTFSECVFLAKFLRANKCKGFRGLSLQAVAFLAFDKGFCSLVRGAFFRLFRFFPLIFQTPSFFRNLCEVMHNSYLQLCNNRVCFGNGEISPGGIQVIVSIYSIKHRSRMNTADGSKITSNRLTQSWRLLDLYKKKKAV